MSAKEYIQKRIEAGTPDQLYSALIKIGKERLFEFRDFAVSKINDANAIVRSGALRALAMYWQEPEYESVARSIALDTSEDAELRADAVSSWGEYYLKTGNKAVLQSLKELLTNNKEEDIVRRAAYITLFTVSNLPREEFPDLAPGDLDADANWALVEKITPS